jgi:hypothetical protein
MADQSQELVATEKRSRLDEIKITSAGVQLATMADMWTLANTIAAARLAPDSYNHDPKKITVALQYGLELGLTPMAALKSIAIINNVPSMWGDVVLARALEKGYLIDTEYYWSIGGERISEAALPANPKDAPDNLACHYRGAKVVNGETVWKESVYTVAMARMTGKWLSTTSSGRATVWITHWHRMLLSKARANLLKDYAPQALGAISLAEDAVEMTPQAEQAVERSRADLLSETLKAQVEPTDEPEVDYPLDDEQADDVKRWLIEILPKDDPIKTAAFILGREMESLKDVLESEVEYLLGEARKLAKDAGK